MEQIQVQQEVITERSIGNLFQELLEKKGRLEEFESLSKLYRPEIVGENNVGEPIRLTPNSFPATVAQVLRTKVLPSQELRFQPAVAGG
ncbi:MAG: hypothetical protein DRI84_09670 [Bacteroidetes bacterium]|jgi:hypothetical protein|nr:MAG: hypothetical protein DRI84_09670 [Bacteroidota bacterium]